MMSEYNHERPVDEAGQQNRAPAALQELRGITSKTWRVDQNKLGEILPPAKELPPQAFQSPHGACSCTTPVACGRFILRPARLQIQASRSLGTPNLSDPWSHREDRGPFGGVTLGVTVLGAGRRQMDLDGSRRFRLGPWSICPVCAFPTRAYAPSRAAPEAMQRCAAPIELRVRCELACIG